MATKKEAKNLLNKEYVWAGAMLANAQRDQFYGRITFEMRAGRIIRLLKEESLQPPKAIMPEKVALPP